MLTTRPFWPWPGRPRAGPGFSGTRPRRRQTRPDQTRPGRQAGLRWATGLARAFASPGQALAPAQDQAPSGQTRPGLPFRTRTAGRLLQNNTKPGLSGWLAGLLSGFLSDQTEGPGRAFRPGQAQAVRLARSGRHQTPSDWLYQVRLLPGLVRPLQPSFCLSSACISDHHRVRSNRTSCRQVRTDWLGLPGQVTGHLTGRQAYWVRVRYWKIVKTPLAGLTDQDPALPCPCRTTSGRFRRWAGWLRASSPGTPGLGPGCRQARPITTRPGTGPSSGSDRTRPWPTGPDRRHQASGQGCPGQGWTGGSGPRSSGQAQDQVRVRQTRTSGFRAPGPGSGSGYRYNRPRAWPCQGTDWGVRRGQAGWTRPRLALPANQLAGQNSQNRPTRPGCFGLFRVRPGFPPCFARALLPGFREGWPRPPGQTRNRPRSSG